MKQAIGHILQFGGCGEEIKGILTLEVPNIYQQYILKRFKDSTHQGCILPQSSVFIRVRIECLLQKDWPEKFDRLVQENLT